MATRYDRHVKFRAAFFVFAASLLFGCADLLGIEAGQERAGGGGDATGGGNVAGTGGAPTAAGGSGGAGGGVGAGGSVGAGGGGGGSGGSDGGGSPCMSVFLTSTTHSIGNQATSFDSLDAADGICVARAASSNLVAGSYVAWLSTSGDSAEQRIGTGCWQLPNGDQVFDDEAEVVGSGPKVAIDETETGGTVAADERVWTGTLANGTVSNNCAQWTTTTNTTGLSGALETGPRWTQAAATNSCANAYHLYCFQVGP